MRVGILRGALASLALAALGGQGAFAQASHASHDVTRERTVEVGGAAMSPSRTVVENAARSKEHTTLTAAIKAAGLTETLSGKGPFTVFAPTDLAFGKLPAGTVDTLVKPENKDKLTALLNYHVLPGGFTSAELMAKAKTAGGKVALKTVGGGELTVWIAPAGGLKVIDAKGGTADVTIADVNQSNGVIHVVDTVLTP